MEQDDAGREVREVNLSSKWCGWKMILFDSDPSTLSFGNAINLVSPQYDGYVAASSSGGKDPFLKAPETMDLTRRPSTKTAWVIEQPDKTKGLNVFEQSSIAIRHLSSGGYLGFDPESHFVLPEQSELHGVTCIRAFLCPECDRNRCVFEMELVGKTSAEDERMALPTMGARVFFQAADGCRWQNSRFLFTLYF